MWLMLAISAAAVWGIDYSLGEEIFKSKISPMTVLALQMLLGAIIIGSISYFSQLKTDLHLLASNRSVLWLFLSMVITFNLGNLLIFYSIRVGENATIVGLAELCYPLFTLFFTWLIFNRNHLNISVLIGGFLIMTGIMVIYYFNPGTP